ncbi:acetyltransferase, GNAT family protein [Reticulomyxa filosa]|uniref:Acetyltransferase, GNAT family protein n=1 Tax=Reticulomyxa filosa TaxID=46433 RepID=X6PG89_RETFI|nr:acetyltransferase, GNAT family protein [Reticulomyxa filosa]|eukprot:ETO37044.1 acetyltransferase, GNAT family protein [Reticulomyxa filosa]
MCCQHMFELGCAYVELHVEAENMAAVNLYKSCNFAIKLQLPEHYLFNDSYHDAFLLIRESPKDKTTLNTTNHLHVISARKDPDTADVDDIALPRLNDEDENDDAESCSHDNDRQLLLQSQSQHGADEVLLEHDDAQPYTKIEVAKVCDENESNNSADGTLPVNKPFIDWADSAFSSLFPKCILL